MKGLEPIRDLHPSVLDPEVISIGLFFNQSKFFFLCFSNNSIDSPRRELENVVKRARKDRDQSQYWNNKVLEAEEKDPNRYITFLFNKKLFFHP